MVYFFFRLRLIKANYVNADKACVLIQQSDGTERGGGTGTGRQLKLISRNKMKLKGLHNKVNLQKEKKNKTQKPNSAKRKLREKFQNRIKQKNDH